MTRCRPADERGAALGLTVLFLVVLLGMAGLVIDVGSWYVKHREAQAAADFGALAAAAELPGDGAAAVFAGEDYVDRNLADSGADVTPGFDGDPLQAEVKVETQADAFFLRVFGWESVDVNARAVAKKITGSTPLAIFAYEDDCDQLGVRYNGNDMNVTGGIHSNGMLTVNGNDNMAGGATSGGPNRCEPYVNGDNITFGGEPMPVEDFTFHDWPIYFTEGQFECDYTAEEFKFNRDNFEIPAGVYCASKLFSANGNDQSGRITVLAPNILINGDRQVFEPYSQDLLFFATGTTEMILDGYEYNWTGVIFHPRGRVKINGDHSSVYVGLIEAVTVEINGNGFSMSGTGASTDDDIALVE
jgi:Putative Flp pilus-assembly TadE/G-like